MKNREEITLKPLIVHTDLRGRLYECWRSDENDPPVEQIIITTIRPGVIKGWHKHDFQYDIVVCVYGEIQVGWWHPSDDIEEYEILSAYNMKKIIIPPGYYHGWRNLGNQEAIVMEAVSELFNRELPDDQRLDPHQYHGEIWITKDS